MNKQLLLCGLAATLSAAMPAAFAQSANFAVWTAAGDVLVDSATAARLTTAAVDSGETPLSTQSALQFSDLEPALSLVPGTLAADTFEGSGLQSSFTAAAGTRIGFHWSLSTQLFDGTQADRAFVIVDGSVLEPLGTVAAGAVSGNYSHSFAAAGSHSLALIVMDVDAYDRVSTLTVSGLVVSAVPEPASWALLLLGAGVVARRAQSRTRSRVR